MPQFTTFCGKEIFQDVSITKILAIKNHQIKMYNNTNITLSKLSISNLDGIEKLNFDGRTQLNLKKNAIDDISPLLSITSTTLKRIILRKNKIEHIAESTLCILRENFPALQRINLRENPLDNKREIREWQKNLGLPFKIKLKKKSNTRND